MNIKAARDKATLMDQVQDEIRYTIYAGTDLEDVIHV